MGQRPRIPRFVIALVGVLVIAAAISFGLIFGRAGCSSSRAGGPSGTSAKSPRIVSLVPAASDIIEGIGAGDHLVAVSNYDLDPRTSKLPRVGDYLTTDWERIAPLGPQVIVTQYAEGRTPPGFAQRVDALGAKQLNLHIDRLDDIYAACTTLGDACGMHDRGVTAAHRLKEKIESIRRQVAGEPPVSALIVIGPEGMSVAGSKTYLDDLLTAAGGKNVAGGLSGQWLTIDHERLAALSPEVIIQLLSNPPPQVLQQAEATWRAMSDIPAVKNGRVVRLTEWYVMQPGYEVGTLAEQFARILHPNAMNQPTAAMPATRP